MDNNINITLKAFDELVDDLNLSSLDEKDKEALLSKLTEVVLKKVFVQAMEKIGKDGRDEYEVLMEKKPNSEEIKKFFSEKIENFDSLIEKTIEELRAEMANGF